MKKTYILLVLLMIGFFGRTQDLILERDPLNDTVYRGAEIDLRAISTDYKDGEPSHLHIVNTLGGYRKLKLGNNPTTLYSPKVNVLDGGNTMLRIVMRKVSGTVDWSKIRFRPSGLGLLSLKKYSDAIGGINSSWATLLIPLSEFDSSIDFTQLTLVEFPYSADASAFEIDVAKIEFIGGSKPYLWYGDDKINNIHDGMGVAGQLVASSVAAIPELNTLQAVDLYHNNTFVQTDSIFPFEYNLEFNTVGLNTFYAVARFQDGSIKTSPSYSIYIKEFIQPDLSIHITASSSLTNDSVFVDSSVNIDAVVNGAISSEPAYLWVKNNNTGYVKLKLGYDPVNIYATGKNVIAGGNNKLQITFKNLSGFTNWSKLRLRPKSLGALNLESYILAVGGVGNEWKTIEIPLTDFDPLIDFTNLNYMEFPYSADAGSFELAIKDIVFTGGDSEFRWFGENKINNSHDGLGGPGQVIAQLIPAQSDENSIKQVEFFVNGNLLAVDNYSPYQVKYIPTSIGEYSIMAKITTNNLISATSQPYFFKSIEPENQISKLKISFLEYKTGDSVLINQPVVLTPFIEGEDLESDIYLKTWNSQTGYMKLKLGYHNQYIYGQFQNAIAGGNNMLEIVIKAFSSNIKWDKIRIRPSSIGILTLDKYIIANSNDWITIQIPLSDFDKSIDFSKLSFFEFPYSADAGAFEIGIKSMRFTGGSAPFEWFGPSHYSNIHDGYGINGSIFAELQLPNPNPLLADSVYLKVNDVVSQFSTEPPFQFSITETSQGFKNLMFELVDNKGFRTASDTVSLKFYELSGNDYSVISLFFDKDPGNVNVSLSPLKYNKDFAYSFTFDDGKIDGYSYGFKLLNGGTISETGESFPGFYFSDGCGNQIPFRASLGWNSVNSSFADIHINTPDYITWTQLQELIAAGWNVLNHSYSHAAYGATDYNFQITENQKAVLAKTAYQMTHFVIPSGDLNYVNPAFINGMHAVYSNKIEFLGYNNGIDVDSPFSTEQLKIYRRYLYDDLFTPSNIMAKIDEVASKSINGNHIWYHDFTHRIIPTPTGGSLVWNTFKFYMQQIADKYGFNGTDRIWFAPPTEILDYLKLRENTTLNFLKSGNRVDVYLNISQANNLSNYFLSLNVIANAELISVSPQFSANTKFANISTTQKLVNIAWSQPTMKRLKAAENFNPNLNNDSIPLFDIYPNPMKSNRLSIRFISQNEWNQNITLFNAIGQEIFSKNNSVSIGVNSIELQTPHLENGIYLLIIKSEGMTVHTRKIVVQ
jgi:peptidoglycan/xylan/chitin deacetylase (PgdA/CDA1 family)